MSGVVLDADKGDARRRVRLVEKRIANQIPSHQVCHAGHFGITKQAALHRLDASHVVIGFAAGTLSGGNNQKRTEDQFAIVSRSNQRVSLL